MAFFLAFFSGTTCGAGTSSHARWASTGFSGMGAGQINCPAPLLEDPADARLTKLLVPAPHVVPEKKAKKKVMGTRKIS